MATLYIGQRSFYQEGNRVFNNESKSVEYDPETLEVLDKEPEDAGASPPDKYVCDICGEEARSNAGLAAHKRFKHSEEKSGSEFFKVKNES